MVAVGALCLAPAGAIGAVPHFTSTGQLGLRGGVVVDATGDGLPDVVGGVNCFSSGLSTGVGVARGLGFGGRFAPVVAAASVPFANCVGPVTAGDVNGDNLPDLVYTIQTEFTNGPTYVALGTGGGSFGAASEVTNGDQENALVVTDVTGDGRGELFVGNRPQNCVGGCPVGVGVGVVRYSFSAAGVAGIGEAVGPTVPVSGLVTGDIDRAGPADLVMFGPASVGATELGVWVITDGAGAGTFYPAHVGSSFFTQPRVGDANDDGFEDVLTGEGWYLPGLAGGGLGAAVRMALSADARDVAIADVDVDGIPDAVATNDSSAGFQDRLRIWHGTGGGVFAPTATVFRPGPVGDTLVSVDPLLLDDSDNLPDLVAVGFSGVDVALNDPLERGLSDAASRGSACSSIVSPVTDYADYRGEGVNTATGAQTEAMIDLDLPGRGIELDLTRCYNSNDTRNGVFGPGWSFSYSQLATATAAGDVNVRSEDGSVVQYKRQTDGSFVAPTGFRSTLEAIPGGGYKLTGPEQDVTLFNTLGRPVSLKDRSGVGVTLAYTGARLTSVTDDSGRTLSFSYNAAGKVSGASLPGGRSVGYVYDASGRLTQFNDEAGKPWTYQYQAAGLLAVVTDPNAHVLFESTYDAQNRVISQKDALNQPPTTFQYVGGRTTTTEPGGARWTDVYVGNVLQQQIDPKGAVTQSGYDASLNPTQQRDQSGAQTTTQFDAAHNPGLIVDPDGKISTMIWDAKNNPTKVTDRLGHETNYTYDGAGRQTKVTDALGHQTTVTYNAQGLVATSTDEDGNTTTFGYDTSGNQATVTSPLGNTTSSVYDPAGRMTSSTDARGKTTTYTYNARGQVASMTDPLGNVTSTLYDDAGNKTRETDPEGGQTNFVYDVVNRLVSVTDPRGGQTTYTYDINGRMVSETRPSGARTTYTFDTAGNRASMTLPKGQATAGVGDFRWTYTYDQSGRELTRTYPNLGSWSTSYDLQGRVTTETDPLGRVTRTEYDAEGRPTKVTSPAGRVTTTSYDVVGRVSSETNRRGGA